ncbi:glycosyltransferase family 4 protein [Alienimonas sp. DA493]|uniref:glycosyltransferase family 4 protein n=1 Tax=Alienimonas sp. DA493 TaxID=3373605 RepID=UPI003754A365
MAERTESAPLRLALVFPEPPLPFGGAAARWYDILLRGLVARGHRVTAFAVAGERERDAVRDLFPPGDFDLRLFPPGRGGGLRGRWATLRRPSSRLFGPELRAALGEELARGYDVLHLEQHWSAWLTRAGLGRPETTICNVHYLHRLDGTGPPATGPAGWKGAVLHRAFERGERRALRAGRCFAALTEPLAAEVRAANPRAEVWTVPMTIDPARYAFRLPEPDDPPTLGLIGNYGWAPTVSAAERLARLWPAIRERAPGARLRFVGRSAAGALSGLNGAPGVEIVGDVPEIAPYFHSTAVHCYAPREGSGMKVKVLESFAFGTPTVTNRHGVEGLPASLADCTALAETDAELVAQTARLLNDPAERRRLAVAARRALETDLAVPPLLDRWEAIHRTIADRRPAAGGGGPAGGR